MPQDDSGGSKISRGLRVNLGKILLTKTYSVISITLISLYTALIFLFLLF